MNKKFILIVIVLHFSLFDASATYQYRSAENVQSAYGIILSSEQIEAFNALHNQYRALIFNDPIGAQALIREARKNPLFGKEFGLLFQYWETKAISGRSLYDSAFILTQNILEQENTPILLKADIYLLEGRTLKYQQNYGSAIESYSSALSVYQEENDTIGQITALINMGEYYRALGRFDLAKKNLDLAQDKIDKSSQVAISLQVYCLNRLSAVFNETDQIEKAKTTALKLIRLLQIAENQFMLAATYNELASIYSKEKNQDSAFYYLEKAIKIWRKTNHTRYWISATGNLVSYHIQNGKFDGIDEILNEAISISKENKWYGVLYTFYSQKAQLNLLWKNNEQATFYFDSLRIALEMDVKSAINKEVAVQLANYEAEQSELDLKILEANLSEEKSRKFALITLLMAALLLIVLLIFFSRSLRSKNQEINRAHQKVKKTLALKESLLKDLHHRVKNNLAFLIGLVHLQKSETKDPIVKSEFDEIKGRLETMALIHSNLLDTSESEEVELEFLLKKIKEQVLSVTGTQHQILLDIPLQIKIRTDKAIILGVIINEIFTNALKHAFPRSETGGIIQLSYTLANDMSSLMISDNGIGIPEDFTFDRPESVGIKLISLLTEQLKGKIEVNPNENAIYLRFKLQ